MSAIAVKVFSGLMNDKIAAIMNRNAKMPNSHWPLSAIAAITAFWAAAPRNMIPMITPTVLTEAWSNWRITTAATVQISPNTSHSHHSFESCSIA